MRRQPFQVLGRCGQQELDPGPGLTPRPEPCHGQMAFRLATREQLHKVVGFVVVAAIGEATPILIGERRDEIALLPHVRLSKGRRAGIRP